MENLVDIPVRTVEQLMQPLRGQFRARKITVSQFLDDIAGDSIPVGNVDICIQWTV